MRLPVLRRCRFPFFAACIAVTMLGFAAACGGGDDDSDDEGDSDSTPEATADRTSSSGGDATATSGGGSSNVDDDDMESLAEDLEPEGAKESVRFAAEGGFTIAWETSKSLDDLKDFYDDRLDDLDINVQGKLDLPDSHTWIIGRADGKGIQGTVTLSKGSSSGDGSLVSVALTKEN